MAEVGDWVLSVGGGFLEFEVFSGLQFGVLASSFLLAASIGCDLSSVRRRISGLQGKAGVSALLSSSWSSSARDPEFFLALGTLV